MRVETRKVRLHEKKGKHPTISFPVRWGSCKVSRGCSSGREDEFIICCPFAMWPLQWQGLVLPCFWKFNLLSDAAEIVGHRDKVERKPSAFPTSFWRCCLRAMTVKYQSPYFYLALSFCTYEGPWEGRCCPQITHAQRWLYSPCSVCPGSLHPFTE